MNQLVSGASVAMEVTGPDVDTPSKFRAFVGPADPVSVRQFSVEKSQRSEKG